MKKTLHQAAVDDIVSIAQEVLQHPWVAVIALNNLLEELLDAIASHIGMAGSQGICIKEFHADFDGYFLLEYLFDYILSN